MKKVLVLCHGNINRSAACAAILRAHGIPEVKSAGFVNPGRRAAKKMREALHNNGYVGVLEDHRSQLITQDLVGWADLIIDMDGGNRKRALNQFGQQQVDKKWRCLAEWSGGWKRIPDPGFMAKDSGEFRNVVPLIIKASKNLAKELHCE